MLDWVGAMFVEVMRSEEIRFCHILNGPIYIMINMAYWVLPSGINQRGYSTFFEASTQCYPPPGCIASV